VEQVLGVADLRTTAVPLSPDDIPARFSGRGPLKKRLPQPLECSSRWGACASPGGAISADSVIAIWEKPQFRPKMSGSSPKSTGSTMANIGALLKAEITRLCRREIRKEMAVVRKATVSSRHHIAALRKQVSALEQKAGQLAKRAGTPVRNEPAVLPDRPVRFVAKGLKSLRARLGLSAAQFATLIGVSEQSVYNWETKKAIPRKEQFATIIELRGIGKREAQQRLQAKAPKPATKKRAKRK